MASGAMEAVSTKAMPQEDLTDEQMEEMLAQATTRLREKEESAMFKTEAPQKYTFPKMNAGDLEKPYVVTKGHIAEADKARLIDEKYRQTGSLIRKVEDPVTARKLAEEKKKATAGTQWYNLPRTDLTPELKRDLQLLKMRNVLDPHRHYKKDGGKMQAPEYSQVGTVIQGPTEYLSARIQNKDRKRTLVEEVLAGEQQSGRFKKKYAEVQTKKGSGKKAFYKDLKAQRKGGVKKGSG
ncbi:hypothetical protein Q7P36_000652 [Cladosporium allicinum]